uniref:Pathogenesis-related protein 10a n=1 Tax=Jatropha curcas TaxID=180498 RepID=G9IBP2_JATCU|nr:pathogenesis-related protein 10a [Jatropha curcas]
MAVTVFERKIASPIPAAKAFKGLVTDADNLVPKILPGVVKSIETVQGNGGIGTIKKTTLHEGNELKSYKHKVDKYDPQNFVYEYSIYEGEPWIDGIEKVTVGIEIEGSGDGGSVVHVSCKTYPKGNNAALLQGRVDSDKQKLAGMVQAIEQYLLANPNAY